MTVSRQIKYVVRYAITHRVDRSKHRVVMNPAQRPPTVATRVEADEQLRDMLANNARDKLVSVFGDLAVRTFEVRPVRCYEHGDPVEVLANDAD